MNFQRFVVTPNELHDLFVGQSEEAKEFRKNIRAINCMFTFTSFGANFDKKLASSRKDVYTFRVNGQVYHDLPSLTPDRNGPCFFQLYFHDTANEIENRLKIMKDDVDQNLMEKIKRILAKNPYVKIFRRLQNFSSLHGIRLHISKVTKLDQRVYNSPTIDQIAAI
ncbi:hypothetical protein LIER_40214 [Lithospermum erythrorhizon]|uniref:Helitron helicase-like domain-containing protein n=1 Tax=Lithospermum erythrorhizon TaxID=34254 RepID=A0AAV3QRB5_LITER